MKTVIVRPERCVGCLQCRMACAVEHSPTKSLAGAIFEATRPQPRLRIYPGGRHLAFPNKCRHCDPAPCQEVCIAGAITPGPRPGHGGHRPPALHQLRHVRHGLPLRGPHLRAGARRPGQGRGGPEVRPVPGPGETRPGAGLCGGLQGGGPDLRRLAHGPGRQRPVYRPGLLCDAPRGGRRQRHPALDPPLAAVGVRMEIFCGEGRGTANPRPSPQTPLPGPWGLG